MKVTQWAWARESHADGGEHYHCALLLSGQKNGLVSKGNLRVTTMSAYTYVTAYQYIFKEDPEVYHSFGHPALTAIGLPRTKQCAEVNRENRRRRSSDTSSF